MTTTRPARSAGVLLHPSSLPGPFGVGDFGPAALDWVDTLAAAGQSWWQILPLGPTGAGDSPYQCFSAFAGNPALISPELLRRDGLIAWPEPPHLAEGVADYTAASAYKRGLLARAYESFRGAAGTALKPAFEAFCAAGGGLAR